MNRFYGLPDEVIGRLLERDRIIDLLREKARHLKQISESIAMDDYMSQEDVDMPYWEANALNEFADALIKGEK